MNISDTPIFSCDIKTGVCSTNRVIGKRINTKVDVHDDNEAKLVVIYYYDALCGWCYGFSPVLSRLEEEFKDRIDFQVVNGGLFLGGRAGFVNEVAPHIKAGAYKSVESRTGVKFGESFLADVFGEGKMTLNSLLPSVALCIVREKFPDKQLEFAAILLKAVYFDGLDPIKLNDYKSYVDDIGIEFSEFSKKMKSKKYQKIAERDFEVFRKTSFSGMPTLVIKKDDDKETLLSSGYEGYDELRERIEKYL